MKLKEKFDNAIWTSSSSEVVEKVEQITYEFAIGFAEWFVNSPFLLALSYKDITIEQTLEIYKTKL